MAGKAPKGLNPRISALDDLEKLLIDSSMRRMKERATPKGAEKPGDPEPQAPADDFKDADVSEASDDEESQRDKQNEEDRKKHFGHTKKKAHLPPPSGVSDR